MKYITIALSQLISGHIVHISAVSVDQPTSRVLASFSAMTNSGELPTEEDEWDNEAILSADFLPDTLESFWTWVGRQGADFLIFWGEDGDKLLEESENNSTDVPTVNMVNMQNVFSFFFDREKESVESALNHLGKFECGANQNKSMYLKYVIEGMTRGASPFDIISQTIH